MKTISFETIFKILILIAIGFALFQLERIAHNSDNGRYQAIGDSDLVLDTKTGKVYYASIKNDTLEKREWDPDLEGAEGYR